MALIASDPASLPPSRFCRGIARLGRSQFSAGRSSPQYGASAGLLGEAALSNHEWHPSSTSRSQNLVASHADPGVGDLPLMRQCLAASLSMNHISSLFRNFWGHASLAAMPFLPIFTDFSDFLPSSYLLSFQVCYSPGSQE